MTRICTTIAIICIVGIIYSWNIEEPVKIQVQELKNASTAGAIVFLLLAIIGWKTKAVKEE